MEHRCLPHGSLRRLGPPCARGNGSRSMFDNDITEKRNDEIAEMQEALGAVAAARSAVFWIFHKDDGRWYVRLESDAREQRFADREAAQDFAKLVAARCQSYRVLVQQDDGSFAELWARWPKINDGAPEKAEKK